MYINHDLPTTTGAMPCFNWITESYIKNMYRRESLLKTYLACWSVSNTMLKGFFLNIRTKTNLTMGRGPSNRPPPHLWPLGPHGHDTHTDDGSNDMHINTTPGPGVPDCVSCTAETCNIAICVFPSCSTKRPAIAAVAAVQQWQRRTQKTER